jgi:hypothetical protein
MVSVPLDLVVRYSELEFREWQRYFAEWRREWERYRGQDRDAT